MTSNYTLSPGMRNFVQQCEAFFPASVVEQGVASQRAAYNAMTAHFARPRPTSVEISDERLNGIKVRRYQPPHANNSQRILFAHGGGWYLGGLDSHDSFCADLAQDCNLTVIAVDYRLAPEAPYPAGLDDLIDVYRALLEENPLPPLLVGDSAGGNLVAALTLRCRKLSLPQACGQILIYPALAAPGSLPSHQRLADAPLLDSASIDFCWQGYTAENSATKNNATKNNATHHYTAQDIPAMNEERTPLQAESLAFLPPAVIFAAEFDPLIDDAQQYSRRLQQEGVPARLILIPGLVHGALQAITLTDEADQLYQSICSQALFLTRSPD